MIDLQPFCGQAECRMELQKPFSHGVFSYATDGRILVRVPRREDVPEIEGAPNGRAASLFGYGEFLAGLPLPEFDYDKFSHPCPECRGDGSICGVGCECCDGTGADPAPGWEHAVSVGQQRVSRFYLDKLRGLPSLFLFPNKVERDAVKFLFNGGEGRLMPLHEPEPDPIWENLQMKGLAEVDQAKRAIGHVLDTIRDNKNVGWYLGLGTQSYALLTEAYATLTGVGIREVREGFSPKNPKDPREEGP